MSARPHPAPSKGTVPQKERPAPVRFTDWASI
jgi:hypothetical protein